MTTSSSEIGSRRLDLAGTRVLLVENHRLPLVSVRVIFHRAGAREAVEVGQDRGDLLIRKLDLGHVRMARAHALGEFELEPLGRALIDMDVDTPVNAVRAGSAGPAPRTSW